MALRSYAGAAKRTTLSGDITATSTNILVADATGYPTGVDGPFAVAFALGNAAEEKVLIASRSGNTLTVATGGRGYDGTSAADHRTGTSVDHVLTAIDVREANAFANGGGVRTSGGDTITASGASVIPLVVKGAASQTADLLQVHKSDGVPLVKVSSTGYLTGTRGAFVADIPNGAALVVRGAASQTANLSEWQNSAGTVLTAVGANGNIGVRAAAQGQISLYVVGGSGASERGALIVAGAAANKALEVRGAASQTANLAEFQNSAGAVLASFTAEGRLNVSAAQLASPRILEFGGPDSAGTGFRTVRVPN